MTVFTRLSLFSLGTLALIGGQERSAGAIQDGLTGYPTAFFKYEPGFDWRYCPSGRKTITQDWVNEATKKQFNVQALWNRQGARLLAMTVKSVGRPFQRKEETVALSLCPAATSMSYPILIGIAPFLASPTNGNPLPSWMLVAEVFHELLHLYVEDKIDYDHQTPLLKRFKNEDFNVLVHLHVIALEKLVYLRLGDEKLLNAVMKMESQVGPAYKRTWEIVNNAGGPGYQGFLAEVRAGVARPFPAFR